MRWLMLIVVLSGTGCSGSPGALGITGPGAPPPTPAERDDLSPVGVPDTGNNNFGPSYGPIRSGNGRYFNYN